jgi:hypothetical protein
MLSNQYHQKPECGESKPPVTANDKMAAKIVNVAEKHHQAG